MTRIVLPSGKTRSSRQPHGVEVEIDRPDLFRARVFVSPLRRRVRGRATFMVRRGMVDAGVVRRLMAEGRAACGKGSDEKNAEQQYDCP